MYSYKPFAEVLGEVLGKSQQKDDHVVPAGIFVGGLKRVGDAWGVEVKDDMYHLTKQALTQLTKDRLGGMPALFNDKDLSERTIQSYLMDKVMAGQENKLLTLRITGQQIDAVLSDAYAFFDNSRLMLLLAGFQRDGLLPEDLRVHSYRVSGGARDLHMRLISPDSWNYQNGDKYFGSLAFSNNETGLGSLTVSPALARVACFNFLVAQNTVEASHRYADVEQLDKAIENGVRHISEYAKVMFERIQHSHSVEFENPESVFHMVGRELSLPEYVENKAKAYWIHEGEERSLFGIVQAWTNGTQAFTERVGRRIERWPDRDSVENRIWMWSENILERHQAGEDVNMLFSSSELIQKSKVLEVLKSNQQWQPATELVNVIEPVGWMN